MVLQRDGGSRDCGVSCPPRRHGSRSGRCRRQQHSLADWGLRGKWSKDRTSAGESLQQGDNRRLEFCSLPF